MSGMRVSEPPQDIGSLFEIVGSAVVLLGAVDALGTYSALPPGPGAGGKRMG